MKVVALGKVTVTAAGTPQPVTATPTPISRVRFSAINDASPNTGKVWVGLSALVKATGVGVLDVLPIPAASHWRSPAVEFEFEEFYRGDLADFYLDSAVNGEGVFVTYWPA
jgi:hypothetical protein